MTMTEGLTKFHCLLIPINSFRQSSLWTTYEKNEFKFIESPSTTDKRPSQPFVIVSTIVDHLQCRSFIFVSNCPLSAAPISHHSSLSSSVHLHLCALKRKVKEPLRNRAFELFWARELFFSAARTCIISGKSGAKQQARSVAYCSAFAHRSTASTSKHNH